MSSSDDDFLYDEDSDDDRGGAGPDNDDDEEEEDDGEGSQHDGGGGGGAAGGGELEEDGEDEDDGIGMDIGEPGPSQDRQDDEYSFEILTTEQIVDHMVDSIKEVNNVMVQMPATTVRILLNHFKWDKEKLMERFYSDDQEKVFKDACIASPPGDEGEGEDAEADRRTGVPKQRPSSTMDCEICYLTLHGSMMTGLACGHVFCTGCWTEYLTTKVMDEGESQSIECPASKCRILVDDQTVMRLVKDPRVRLKYQHLITNSFVECNRLMRWCSAPDCNFAVRVRTVEARPVRCKCGHVYCFKCAESWHDPVRCHLIRKWIKKCDDDSETSNWISANTKECPKCRATIEKDGGCNHMICKNQACKADFCWACLGPWEPHGSSWYNCNRFDEEEARSARTNQERSRAALQRYLFYCNRYMNHLQSLKFESKLYAMVKDKMEEMQQHNMSWIEVQFLKKAVDVLCECRRTLMNTYVFAYYLLKNNQSELFEENQKDLENSTETLSEYLERDICAENMTDIKQKVQDKYRYCESRRKVLLHHVYEGYDKDWWQYTEADAGQ